MGKQDEKPFVSIIVRENMIDLKIDVARELKFDPSTREFSLIKLGAAIK
jgi:hypothetical protein